MQASRQQGVIVRLIVEEQLKTDALARRLGISPRSVTTQLGRLYAKLDRPPRCAGKPSQAKKKSQKQKKQTGEQQEWAVHGRVGLAVRVFVELMRLRAEKNPPAAGR